MKAVREILRRTADHADLFRPEKLAGILAAALGRDHVGERRIMLRALDIGIPRRLADGLSPETAAQELVREFGFQPEAALLGCRRWAALPAGEKERRKSPFPALDLLFPDAEDEQDAARRRRLITRDHEFPS